VLGGMRLECGSITPFLTKCEVDAFCADTHSRLPVTSLEYRTEMASEADWSEGSGRLRVERFCSTRPLGPP
jgi:hypothetical protein